MVVNRCVLFLFAVACVFLPLTARAQNLTGTLIGTVKDASCSSDRWDPVRTSLLSEEVLPRTGFVVAGNLQYFSGKPWAATTQVSLAQGDQRIFLEPRGTRRLPSQTLLDLRLSRTIRFAGAARVELLADVLNALNDAAAESILTDNLFSSNFARPTAFIDPRRAMFGVRASFGK